MPNSHTKEYYVFGNFLNSFFKYIFRDRGKEGEREREKHQCVVASHTPQTGDLVHNSGMCPDWELNQLLFDSQACTQSTELHQPGLTFLILNFRVKVLYL